MPRTFSPTSKKKPSISFPISIETREEPVVLPTRIPNLLVNGASGIAVGMATNIPPHNLREIVEAAILLIEKPDTTLKEIMKIVPGPDFPTGGYIAGREGIEQAYKTGRGSFISARQSRHRSSAARIARTSSSPKCPTRSIKRA